MRSTLRARGRQVTRNLLLIGTAILILGIGIGIGSSIGIPGASTTRANGGSHHACINRYTGQMRYVQSPSQCVPTEYPVSWGQQGLAGYEWVRSDLIPVAAGESEIHRLSCPNGKVVLGGGGVASYVAESNPAVPEPNMFWSFPFDEHSWQIAVHNDTNQAQEMRAYAICTDAGL